MRNVLTVTMRVTITIAFLLAFSTFATGRRYYADEERGNSQRRFVTIPDGKGRSYLVDLKNSENGYIGDIANVGNITDVSFHLFTRQNPHEGVKIEASHFNGTISSPNYKPDKVNIFVTHGWLSGQDSFTCRMIRDAVLAEDDANVFVIDWERPANEFYTISKQSVPILGKIVADWIGKFSDVYEVQSSDITMVGPSLGAHILGIASGYLRERVGVIVGLDPAQPLFYIDEPDDRLSIDDGRFVHVLHTNAGFLGFKSSIGHADYFPNGGGMAQPGCGPDVVGKCAHGRSSDYYAESLLTSGFRGRKCESYEEYKKGRCNDNEVSYFGEYNVDKKARGDYYFDTNPTAPFAQN